MTLNLVVLYLHVLAASGLFRQPTMPTDCHKSGVAAMSRTMPEKTADRRGRGQIQNGVAASKNADSERP